MTGSQKENKTLDSPDHSTRLLLFNYLGSKLLASLNDDRNDAKQRKTNE
jgi:hypothetical protein